MDKYLFICVHKVRSAIPSAETEVLSAAPLFATLIPGPFAIERCVMVDQSGPGMALGTMGVETVHFPEGSFLSIAQEVEFDGLGPAQARARIANAEMIAVCDLLMPGWIGDKKYEGSVMTPGVFAVTPEGLQTLRGWTTSSDSEIREVLTSGYSALADLSAESRERFGLMSRWYRKSTETDNLVDRFLFLYTALEVFPAHDSSDVPGRVRDLLHAAAFPDVPPAVVKERLRLGRLTGTRNRIVHDGKSVVGAEEWSARNEELKLLEAVTYECLQLLAGRPYTGRLDQWVRVG